MQTPTHYQVLDLGYPARWWTYTTHVRQLVEAFCAHMTGSPEFSSRVGMTCHELLENAVKFSPDEDAIVSCEVTYADGKLAIAVGNEATPANIETLEDEFALVKGGDPLEIYIMKMEGDLDGLSARLGLARCRYEGEARLEVDASEGFVTVRATFEVPPRQALDEAVPA